MTLNPKNPEVQQALEDVANGTLEPRRLLIAETQIVHDIQSERNIGADQWRATAVDYALRMNERIYRSDNVMTLTQMLHEADTIAQYLITGDIPE